MSQEEQDSGALLENNEPTTTSSNKWTLSTLVQNRIVQVTGVVLVLLFTFFAGALVTILIYQTLEAPGNNPNNPNKPKPNTCVSPPRFANHFENDTDSVVAQHIQQAPLLLSNVIILDNSATPVSANAMDILIVNGKIAQIGGMGSLRAPAGTVIVNGQGRFVSSGIVDMHSHLGVYTAPGVRAHSDGNELTNPTTPFVRAIDALNPTDPAIRQMLKGGVTTALVLPGSGNTMGGEAVHVKTKGATVGNMYIRGAPRALKFACGENPKRVYGSKGQMPASRMGSAWVMRRILDQARQLMQRQDDWDCDPANANKDVKYRPSSLELEPLVGLLRGQNIILNVHCYEVEDFEMMLRLSKEFNFKINTFHHALEAYKIANVIAVNNITIATFADLWGYKMEAYEASVKSPKILADAGVKVALKSDHPVTHSKDMMHQAGKAYYYGLSADAAIKAVTSIPANAIGLGHRLGRVQVGYDADLVTWDRHPLLLGATPNHVMIEGVVHVDHQLPVTQSRVPWQNPNALRIQGKCDVMTANNAYAVRGVKIYTMDDTNRVLENSMIVVQNGMVTCVSTNCILPLDCTVFDQQGGIVIPGIIETSTRLGLEEIQAESVTNDGVSNGYLSPTNVPYSKDGVKMLSRTMRAAWKSGVTTSVSHRSGSSIVGGFSSAFNTLGWTIGDSIVKDAACLQITIGNDAKGEMASISGQVAVLRGYLQRSLTAGSNDVFAQVTRGNLPICLISHQADDIAHVLQLQQEFAFSLIIIGGAEAHLLSSKLANPNITVILTPMAQEMAPVETWDTLRSSNNYYADRLYNAGVNILFGSGSSNPYDVRNLRWVAGMASSAGQGIIPEMTALSMITRRVADAFGLNTQGRIVTQQRANFVLFDGNPLTFEGRPQVVALGNRVECTLEQFK